MATVPVLVPWTTASEHGIHRSYDEGEWVSGKRTVRTDSREMQLFAAVSQSMSVRIRKEKERRAGQ